MCSNVTQAKVEWLWNLLGFSLLYGCPVLLAFTFLVDHQLHLCFFNVFSF